MLTPPETVGSFFVCILFIYSQYTEYYADAPDVSNMQDVQIAVSYFACFVHKKRKIFYPLIYINYRLTNVFPSSILLNIHFEKLVYYSLEGAYI